MKFDVLTFLMCLAFYFSLSLQKVSSSYSPKMLKNVMMCKILEILIAIQNTLIHSQCFRVTATKQIRLFDDYEYIFMIVCIDMTNIQTTNWCSHRIIDFRYVSNLLEN